MCVVSNVMDYGQKMWPDLLPAQQPWFDPTINPALPTPLVPSDYFKEIDIGGVKKAAQEAAEAKRKAEEGRLPTKAEIEAFLKLVKAAEEFDKRASQPHCEDPEKIKLLEAIERRLASLEEKVSAIGEATGSGSVSMLLGSSNLPTNLQIGDRNYTLGEIVRIAHRASDMAPEDWNRLPERHREHLLVDVIADLREEASAP